MKKTAKKVSQKKRKPLKPGYYMDMAGNLAIIYNDNAKTFSGDVMDLGADWMNKLNIYHSDKWDFLGDL